MMTQTQLDPAQKPAAAETREYVFQSLYRMFGTGIAFRVTQLAWLVTLAGLCMFIAFMIPEQKRELRQGLESKAHGIAAALQGEVAGAAVSEDYTSVVEHAMQVVAGDPEVQFLVIAKSDGYSVVIEHGGWKVVPQIGPQWSGGQREPSSAIDFVPLVQKRLFHYKAPFDYTGIPWGWVHVGLSLSSYDESVKDVYWRTGLMGVVCILLSLGASMLFAKRFVQPILTLRGVVEKITRGDLEARAEIRTNDEIEQLASAFNEMANAVLQRDQIVESVRFAAQALQESDRWEVVADQVLSKIGRATKVSRVLLVRHDCCSEGSVCPTILMEWELPGIAPYDQAWAGQTLEQLNLATRRELLTRGHLVVERSRQLRASPIPGPEPQPLSKIAAPIFADDRFWGALVLQDCLCDREWHEVEQNSVRAIGDMLGACIERQRAQEDLVQAKNELERRVEERTVELKSQIAAKDRAHKDLQLMQKQLIDASRLSGMAEVATGVLHNVGNVLNSVNVSATLLMDHLRASRLVKLQEISHMLSDHSDALPQFLASDPRGQRVLPYLNNLSKHLLDEREMLRKETISLVQNVGHIKEVVAMQQGYARAYGVLEKVAPQDLMEDAINISGPAIDRHKITLRKEIQKLPTMTTDRHKVLQILLNLVQNAKDAVKAGSAAPRLITLRLAAAGEDRVRFEVEDNGVGIASENLTKIFSHGFTTKESGHGFGLHSGALAAMELGGTLRAESRGIGEGALFVLELPQSATVKKSVGGMS